MRFGIYTNSEGNYFLDEIRDLLISGLSRYHRARACDEIGGFDTDVDWHIVIAPHEFFYIGNGIEMRSVAFPRKTIFVTTEQHGTDWHVMAQALFHKARVIWEIDPTNAVRMSNLHEEVHYLPLSFDPSFHLFKPIKRLPQQQDYFFGKEIRESASFLNRQFRDRPIDLFFIGGYTPRRNNILSSLHPALDGICHYFILMDTSRPVRTRINTSIGSRLVCGLEQRSKVVLNLHRSEQSYFESHRMIIHGLAQGAVVVSESLGDHRYEGMPTIIESAAHDLPGLLAHLLKSKKGQDKIEDLANEQYKRFISEKHFYNHLVRLIDLLPAYG